jgi:hypothetical protein
MKSVTSFMLVYNILYIYILIFYCLFVDAGLEWGLYMDACGKGVIF